MNTTTAQAIDFADAQGLLETLKGQAIRQNKKKNLDLLWAVLTGMHQEGCPEYALAEVGRRMQKLGGPKTQSLRNEGGKAFRDLIEAFASSAGVAIHAAPSFAGKSQLDIAVETLADAGLRAMFRQVVAENKLLKGQNDQLRSSFKALSVSLPTTVSPPPTDSPVGTLLALTPPMAELTSFEWEVLSKSVSPDRFAENGWALLENGGVADDAGVVVLPPGFVTIMQKLMARSARDTSAE